MTRSPADHPDLFAPSLRHEFGCASRRALVAAYTLVSEAPWVECCCVDLPNLRLALSLPALAVHPGGSTREWLKRISRIAQELPAEG
jgi:hypothetical protein